MSAAVFFLLLSNDVQFLRPAESADLPRTISYILFTKSSVVLVDAAEVSIAALLNGDRTGEVSAVTIPQVIITAAANAVSFCFDILFLLKKIYTIYVTEKRGQFVTDT